MKKIIIITIILMSVFIIFKTPLICNLWNLLIGRGYFIPKESSILTFKPIVMNEGSGEWWLYGEDNNNYYSMENTNNTGYIFLSKKDAKKCEDFISTNYKTWCRNNN